MSMDKIRDWLREHRITEVECLVPDMTGKARGKFIPADKFIKEDSRLPESILVQTVTGDYTEIARRLHALNRPTVIVQEGGYHLEALGKNVVAFLEPFAA